MQQVEWSIPADAWAGLNTKYEPSTKLVLPDEFTSGSVNYEIDQTGSVVKRTDTENYNPVELDFPIKDEFEMIFTSGERHKLVMSNGELFYTTGDGVFTSAEDGYTPEANMEFASYQNRVYFGNGIDDPQVYDVGTSYGGVSYTPPTVADAGAIPPSTPLSFGADTAGGNVPAGAHTYKVTFLYYGTEESNGSTASAVHTVSNPDNTVNFTSIPTGGVGVTARKIYRDNNDGVWLLVKTINDNTSTTASDTAALGTLPIPTDNNPPPTWGLVTQYRDRLWVAGVSDAQSTLYYSDAGLPDIWPTNNFIACNPRDTINALAVYNDKVVVFGKASFGIILGTTSDNFRYIDISPNIGCVDCRSIQTITVFGVPKLQWLSQFGIYQWDGSNLQLVSDRIDNLLKFNIQQASGAQQKNIQTTQADFQGGTSSPGIDLDAIPGTITTHGYSTTTNPTQSWDSQAEWEGGSSLTDLATRDGSNTLKSITRFTPTYASSTLVGNATVSGSNLTLPITADFTGETVGGTTNVNPRAASNGETTRFAQPFIPTRSGVLNSVTFQAILSSQDGPWSLAIWADNLGQPGTVLYSTVVGSSSVMTNYGMNPNLSLTAGTKYYFGAMGAFVGGPFVAQTTLKLGTSTWSGGHLQTFGTGSLAFWTSAKYSNSGVDFPAMAASYTFTSTPIASSGLSISTVYNTNSVFNSGATIAHTATYPAGTSAVTTIDASNDPLFVTGVVTASFNNLSTPFPTSIGLSDKQYWRVTVQVNTNDNRVVPTINPFILRWPSTSTWISDVVDHTADITSLDALVMNATTPAGTTATVTIATSANNITYSSFTAVGSATPQRYSKVKVVLTTDAADTVTAFVTSVRLDWTVQANLISSAISTVVTPAGWGLFQADYETNGGTLLFEARTAPSEMAVQATGTITIVSFAGLTGKKVTINGTDYTEGVDWTAAGSNGATASSLQAAITPGNPDVIATVLSNVVTLTAIPIGALGNAITLTTNGTSPTDILLSGATLTGGLDGLEESSWVTVFNGVTIAASLYPWIQWRVTITSSANSVPQVHSVTINWKTVTGTGIRVASLFYNQVYYLAAAEFGSTTNNIVLYYDRQGRWGQFADLHINTMGLFFASPYFGEADSGFYVNWLNPSIVTDGAIRFDIRTKAYSSELIADDKTKMLRHMIIECLDTAATITPQYSIDQGTTWKPMIDVTTGLTDYIGSNTGSKVKLRFVPQASDVIWGYELMLRISNNDEFPVTIVSLRAKAYISDRQVLVK